MPTHKVKLLLKEVKRNEAFDFQGCILFRESGPVRIITVQPSVVTYRFLDADDQNQSWDFKGFYKVVAFVVDDRIDPDNKFLPIRKSEFDRLKKWLQRDSAGRYYTGTDLTKIRNIVKLEFDNQELFFNPHAKIVRA